MMLEWINVKYGTNLTEEDLLEIRNFTLLWNIFENTLFQNNFAIGRLERIIVNGNYEINEFVDILTYFRNRYTEDGAISERFRFLNFRATDREAIVRNVMLNLPTSSDEQILALGIIVYRYRNNLFHGEKNFTEIRDQQRNFNIANNFLRIFLDH